MFRLFVAARRIPRIGSALALAATATGCLITTSLDGFSSGGPVEPPAGGALRDAALDGAAVRDAGDGGTIDAGPFCVREKGKGHLLCSDFATGTPLDGAWTGTGTETGGTATVDATTRVFVSTTAALETNATSKGILIFKTTKTVTKATFAYDLNVVSCPLTVDGTTKGQATIASLGQGEDPRWIVGLLLSSDGFLANTTRCAGTCSGTSIPLPGGLSFGKWSHISQTIDVAGSKMSMSIDGITVLTDTPVTLVTGANTSFILNIGLANRGPASACRAEFDNVTLDAQ